MRIFRAEASQPSVPSPAQTSLPEILPDAFVVAEDVLDDLVELELEVRVVVEKKEEEECAAVEEDECGVVEEDECAATEDDGRPFADDEVDDDLVELAEATELEDTFAVDLTLVTNPVNELDLELATLLVLTTELEGLACVGLLNNPCAPS